MIGMIMLMMDGDRLIYLAVTITPSRSAEGVSIEALSRQVEG